MMTHRGERPIRATLNYKMQTKIKIPSEMEVAPCYKLRSQLGTHDEALVGRSFT